MSIIHLITTGGTIAMRRVESAAGAIPQLTADDLISRLRSDDELRTEDLFNLPSSHLTIELLTQLVQRVRERVAEPDVSGVVVTHGTDTLEETATLLDLVHDSPKPVVLTGAMRTASAIGYDGVGNLAAAIQVAQSPAARDHGVLVAFNDRIWAAREVQKTHGQAFDAFSAPGFGPLGTTAGGEVVFFHRIVSRRSIPFRRLVEPVDLITVTQAGDDRLLRAAIETGARGIVIEALGGGRVPPWWLPALRTAQSSGLPIVVCSRTGAGTLGDEYGYPGATHELRQLGCIFAHGLNGPKARITLMLALGAADSPAEIASLFDDRVGAM